MNFTAGQWPNISDDLCEFLINREHGGEIFYPETIGDRVSGLVHPHKWGKVDGTPDVGKRLSFGQAKAWVQYLRKVEPDRPALIAHVGEGSI